MMIYSTSQGLFLCLLCLIVGVLGQQNGGSLQCHPSPWVNGQPFKITLRVDRTKFPSLCAGGTDGKPIFEGSSDGVAYRSNCTVLANINSTGTCSYTPGTPGCGCTNSDDNGFYVIEYNFVAGPDHYRWWKASLACFENSLAQAINFPDICNQTELTTTTTVTSVTTPTTVTAVSTVTSTTIVTAVSTVTPSTVVTAETVTQSTTTNKTVCYSACDFTSGGDYGVCIALIVIVIALFIVLFALVVSVAYIIKQRSRAFDQELTSTPCPHYGSGDNGGDLRIRICCRKCTSCCRCHTRKEKQDKQPAETIIMTKMREISSSPEQDEAHMSYRPSRVMPQPSTMAQQGDIASSNTPVRLRPMSKTHASNLPSVERNSARDLPLPNIQSTTK